MSNSVLKSNAFFARERSLAGPDRRSARAAAAGAPPAPKSYHNRSPRHRLERLAEALDPLIDLVGGSEIELARIGRNGSIMRSVNAGRPKRGQ
jgi:hypothetical protein